MRKCVLLFLYALCCAVIACDFDESGDASTDVDAGAVERFDNVVDTVAEAEEYKLWAPTGEASFDPNDTQVVCGGNVYIKEHTTCSNNICRTSNTPTECLTSQGPCEYFTGTCTFGSFSKRNGHSQHDLFWPSGTPGNPENDQGFWALYSGSPGQQNPIYYRIAGPQLLWATSDYFVPSNFSNVLTTTNASCSGGAKYLRAINPTVSGGRWLYTVPAGLAGGQTMFFQGSCSGGDRPYRNGTQYDYFAPNHGWHGGAETMVLDGGPSSGSPWNTYIRPVRPYPAQPPINPPGQGGGGDDGGDGDGDDDDGGDWCESGPFGGACETDADCCDGRSCMDTISTLNNQCCECVDWMGVCRVGAACD